MSRTVKKKKKAFRTILIALIVLIVLTISAAVTCVALACQDPYCERYSTEDTVTVDSNLIAEAAKSAVFGKEYTASSSEVNSYIRKALTAKKSSTLKDLAVYFHEDGLTEVYGRLKLDVNGTERDFAFSSNADFSVSPEKTLDIKLSNANLGLLPIPDFVLAKVLDKTLDGKIAHEYTTISLPVSFETEIEGIKITLFVKEFTPKEESVTIKSNDVLADTLDSATDRAKKWIAEHRDELAEYSEDFEEWIDANRDKLADYEKQAEEWVDNNPDTIKEYTDKAEEWIKENSDTVSEYTDKAKDWLESHMN